MPLPGFVSVHNCLPYDIEFQCDMRPYVLKAHQSEVMTIPMAQCCIKASMYLLDADNIPHYGAWLDADPNKPDDLSYEDIGRPDPSDPLQSSGVELQDIVQIGGQTYGPPTVVKVPQSEVVSKRRPVDPKMSFIAQSE
jgi:hypothetical protein